MLSDVNAGDKIKKILLCKIQKIGTSSNGGVFARGTVSDNSLSLPFICFDSSSVEFFKNIVSPAPCLVLGSVDINRYADDGSLQIMIQRVDVIPENADLTNLLPVGDLDLNKYEMKFKNLVEKINSIGIKKLLEGIFQGQIFYSFKTNPAGMKLHHAYIGGLLEHSVDVAELSFAMGEKIKNVNIDYIIAGSLLHDLGKLKEISQNIGFPYTTEGKLLGHIPLSVMMIKEVALNLEDKIDDMELQNILHIVLSHHGTKEKGSPIECKTKEAFIVHYADELDSIMNQFRYSDVDDDWFYSRMLSRDILIQNLDD